MTKPIVLSAALALLLPLLAVSSSVVDFDYFYLVQQWPGAQCGTKRGCCFPDAAKPAADFGIHGLWPQYLSCRPAAGADAFAIVDGPPRKKCWPANCDDRDPLSLLQIRDLLPELERNWPTLSCKKGATYMDFWSHEWRKHGTCSGFDQHGYFEASLALKARHNLTAILAGAGIVPSDEATYHLSGVRDAIREATEVNATVECSKDASGAAQLYQVYLCVAADGSGRLIDCPPPVNRKCADKIKLPPF
ncbi:hypothetical protein ACP70R_031251 [Stipagrostis hirtigluma subsp. patula]